MQNLIISSVTESDYLQSVELRDDISDICSEIKKLNKLSDMETRNRKRKTWVSKARVGRGHRYG